MTQLEQRSVDLATSAPRQKCPLIATNYEGGDEAFLARILPLVDCLEVVPDSLAAYNNGRVSLHEPNMRELRQAAEQVKILVHGVGLSIGSHEGFYEPYLQLLEGVLQEVDVLWHSEHLGFTRVDGNFIGTMLTLPRTKEVCELVCERVNRLQDRFKLPFLLENVARILPDYPADFSVAAFLNEITRRTGCGLILDVYNLECDVFNHGFAIDAFLEELDLGHVREIHMARGVEHENFLLDIHSRRLKPSTVALCQKVVAMAGGAVEVVTFELLSQAVPALGYDAVVAELDHLHHVFRE